MSSTPPSSAPPSDPLLSIVIPVHNEAVILEASIRDLCAGLADFTPASEIILAENGSSDDTVAIARRLAGALPGVRVIELGEPNYGKALRQGILAARGTFVHCDEIDICDMHFHRRAHELLAGHDGRFEFIVGSKTMAGAHDQRPLVRRAATRVINWLLRLLLGLRGTDTHGLKAFRRDAILPVVERCVVENDMFASELVVRAERAGKRMAEIPLTSREKRPPSIQLARRVPRVLTNLLRLVYVVRIKTR